MVQKHVNIVDLVKSFLTSPSIYLQRLASIQPRTSRSKLADTNQTPGSEVPLWSPLEGVGAEIGTAESSRKLCRKKQRPSSRVQRHRPEKRNGYRGRLPKVGYRGRAPR